MSGEFLEGHLLQSEKWQNFEKLEGEECFALAGDGWSARGIVVDRGGVKYLYVKYGPVLTAPAKLVAAVQKLKALARVKGAIFVRIEPTLLIPDGILKKIGAEKVREINPEHTWVLDLKGAEAEILSGMESNKTRSHRNAGKHGMRTYKTREPEKVEILVKMLNSVAERDNFTPVTAEHLRHQMEAGFATLFVVEYSAAMEAAGGAEGKYDDFVPVAAALVYDYGGMRYYAHAGTDENYKKLRAGAVLLVEMILDAKKNGGLGFDFWGITTSSDPKHPWYGFTQFKKSFGGREVDYAGCYDIPVDKMKYSLYKMGRKVNRVLRKIR